MVNLDLSLNNVYDSVQKKLVSVGQETFRDINNILTTVQREITNIEMLKKKEILTDGVLVQLMLSYKREDLMEERK